MPIRESGSLVPQAGLIPFIRSFEYAKRALAQGSILQGIAVVGIGLAGASLMGLAAGVAVLDMLTLFSLARAVSSISRRDPTGKTLPGGNRGTVTGIAASVAGHATIVAGLVLASAAGGADHVVLAFLVGGSFRVWFGASAVFMTIDEHPSSGEESDRPATVVESLQLIGDDVPFRRFIVTRTMTLVTALSPPLVVAMTAHVKRGGSFWRRPARQRHRDRRDDRFPDLGRLADRSSRLVMAMASGSAGLILLAFIGGRAPGLDSTAWLGPTTYLLLAIVHPGARMAGSHTWSTWVAGMSGPGMSRSPTPSSASRFCPRAPWAPQSPRSGRCDTWELSPSPGWSEPLSRSA